MAAPDTTGIDQKVETDIYTSTSIDGPKPNAASFRGVFKAFSAWVKKSIVEASIWKNLDGSPATDPSATVARPDRTIFGRMTDDGTGALVQIADYPSINKVLMDMTMLPGQASIVSRYDTTTLDFNTLTNAGVFRLDGAGWKADGNTPSGVFGAVTTYGLLVVSKTRDGFVKQEYMATDGTYYWRLSYPGSGFIAWQQPYRFTPGDFTTTGYLQTGKDNLPFKITTARAGANLSLRTDNYLELVTPGGTYKLALIN